MSRVFVYGQYLSRVRHSFLRRPIRRPVGYPVASYVREFTSYLVYLYQPHVVVPEEKYCIQIQRTRGYGETSIVCTNIKKPSLFYAPKEWCYTYFGEICDYIASLHCYNLYRPHTVWPDIGYAVEIRGLPMTQITTSYLIYIYRKPAVTDAVDYLFLISRPKLDIQEVLYNALIVRPRLDIQFSTYLVEQKPLPKYADEITYYVETGKIPVFTLYGGISPDDIATVVRANVYIVDTQKLGATYKSLENAIAIFETTSDAYTTHPSAVLSYVPSVDYKGLWFDRPSVFETAQSKYTTFGVYDIYARYIPFHTVYIDRSNVYIVDGERYLSFETGVNLVETAYSSVLASLGLRLFRRFSGDALLAFYMPNVFDTTNTAYETRPILKALISPVSDVYLEFLYSPVVVTAYERGVARYTPQNIYLTDFERLTTYGYRTLSARLLADILLSMLLIEPSRAFSTSYEVLNAFRTSPNLFETSATGYEFRRTYRLTSQPELLVESILHMGFDIYETAYGSYYAFTKYGNVHGYTQTQISAEYRKVNALNVVLIDSPPLTFIWVADGRPGYVGATSLSSLRHVPTYDALSYTSTSVYAEYKSTVPAYIYGYTSSSLLSAYARYLNESALSQYRGAYARYIVLIPTFKYYTQYIQPTVFTLSQSSIYARYFRGNIIGFTYSYPSLIVKPSNTIGSTRSDYVIRYTAPNASGQSASSYLIKIYRAIAGQTYADYYAVIAKPNSYGTDYSSYQLYYTSSNTSSTSQSVQGLYISAPRIRSDAQSYIGFRVQRSNTAGQSKSSYSLKIYRFVTLSILSSVSDNTLIRLYRVKTLAIQSSVSATTGISFGRADIELSGRVKPSAAAYCRSQ